jgi:hypothetical protein
MLIEIFLRLSIEEKGEFRTQPIEFHIVSFIIYLIVFCLLVNILLRDINLLRKNHDLQLNISKSILGSLIGIILMITNLMLLRVSLILTNSQYAFLSRENGIFYAIGLTMFIYFYLHTGLEMISMKKVTKARISSFLNGAMVIASIGIVLTTISIFQIIEFSFLKQWFVVSGAFIVFIGFILSLLLYYESRKSNYSKFKQYRIKFMALSLISITIDGLFLTIYFALITLSDSSGYFFIFWSAIERAIMLGIAFLFTHWSLFFPQRMQKMLNIFDLA